eukprot:49175-Prorocentrum_minimum.AAC.1
MLSSPLRLALASGGGTRDDPHPRSVGRHRRSERAGQSGRDQHQDGGGPGGHQRHATQFSHPRRAALPRHPRYGARCSLDGVPRPPHLFLGF